MKGNVTSKAIAENIYYLAKFRKYPIYEVEQYLGLSKGYISRVRNGEKKRLSVDVVAKAMRFFDVDFDDILFTDYQYLWKDQEITNYVFKEDSDE